MELVNVALSSAGAPYASRLVAMAIEEAAEMTGVVIVLLGVLTAVQVRWTNHHLTLAYAD